MDQNNPVRRTRAEEDARMGMLSDPHRVTRSRHRAVDTQELARQTPYRNLREVFAGHWNDLPEIDRVLSAARQKDFHNNRATQRHTLRFCVEIVMRNGGLLPGHEKYRPILDSTVEFLAKNNLMRSYARRVTRSLWTGQKHTMTTFVKADKADVAETARLHHVPVEFMIGGLLVYQVLAFNSRESGKLNDLVEKQAPLLTSALFNWDQDRKPDMYTIDSAPSRDQSGPASWVQAHASALLVAEAAETFFSVNLDLSTESAEQQQLNTAEITSPEVHAAMRAARGLPNWSCDEVTLERITRLFASRVSALTMLGRAAWKQRIDTALTQQQILPPLFWINMDPDQNIVNNQGEVLTSLFTTNMGFINARDSMLRTCRSADSTSAERRDSINRFNNEALPIVEVLRVEMEEWRTHRSYALRQRSALQVNFLDELEQWLALIHPPAQIEDLFP